MTVIHAHRRTKVSHHEFAGTIYKFAANERGHFVADVSDERAIERFLSLPEAFVRYRYQPEDSAPVASPVLTQAPQPPAGPNPRYVLKGADGSAFDLNALDDKALRAFARANELTAPNTVKGDSLRELIVVGLERKADEASGSAQSEAGLEAAEKKAADEKAAADKAAADAAGGAKQE